MQKFNFLFFVLGASVGLLILLISLSSANREESLSSERGKLLTSKLYVAREILPDHTMYPVLMIVDRLRLELVEPENRSALLLAYGKRRLFYSEKLLQKGQRELSFITLSKAIKYYQQALEQSIANFDERLLSNRLNQELSFMAIDEMKILFDFVTKNRDSYADDERVVIDLLIEQSKFSLLDLQEILYQWVTFIDLFCHSWQASVKHEIFLVLIFLNTRFCAKRSGKTL